MVKLTKSQIKELIRHSIRELTSEREDVTESKKRRFTVKEVRMWMKKLEENRYKKVYNSDARRVAWMVNNEGVELSEMPKSMSKKWTKAQYGRERYLATEFLKSKSEQMNEALNSSFVKKMEKAVLKGKDVVVYDKKGKKYSMQSAFDGGKGVAVTDYLGSERTWQELPLSKVKKIVIEGKLTEFQKIKLPKGKAKVVKTSNGWELLINNGKTTFTLDLGNKDRKFRFKGNKLNTTEKDAINFSKKLMKHSDFKGLKLIEGKLTSEQKLREQIREIIKEQLNEVKFKKVILPNDMKTKVKVSKMIKQLKLKIDKDYDVKALKARGGDQVISILPKHYNKFIELAMKNKLNPRG